MWRPLLAAAAAAGGARAEDAHCHWRSYAARYDDVRAAFGTDESKRGALLFLWSERGPRLSVMKWSLRLRPGALGRDRSPGERRNLRARVPRRNDGKELHQSTLPALQQRFPMFPCLFWSQIWKGPSF